jgi:diaminopimelate decarboxylase
MANYLTNISMAQYPEIASPAYVLEENLLINNLQLLQRVQKEAGVEIICALKGFSFYHAFPIVMLTRRLICPLNLTSLCPMRVT